MPLVDTIETYQMTNVGDHIDGTDVYQSNRNLLDNAYFVGGGSQLGDGVFPINQRGQSSYGASMYGIDRWRTWGNMTVALTAAGLSLTSTEAAGLFQYPEQNRIMAMMGETVTFSVKVGGQVYSNTGTIYSGAWLAVQVPSGEAIFVVPQSYPSELISVSYRFSGAVSTPVVVQAMKLELGTVSTLANDPPPDFGEELRKCQRYLYIPTFPWYAWTGTVAMATSATAFNWVINTPVPMRQGAIPTIGITGSVYINGTAASNLSIVNAPTGNLVKISGTSAGMTNAQLYPVNTSADNVSVILSAEL